MAPVVLVSALMPILLLPLLLLALALPAQGFTEVYMNFSHGDLRVPVAFTIAFEMTWDMELEEVLRVGMPRFTDGRAVGAPIGETPQYTLRLSPSVQFEAAWVQSARGVAATPYADSAVLIRIRDVLRLPRAGDRIRLEVLADNGLFAYCSFPASFNVQSARPLEAFTLTSSTSGRVANTPTRTLRNVSDSTVTAAINHDQMGPGCDKLAYCSGHGLCDFCLERCACFDGFGSEADLVYTGAGLAPSCRDRVCPVGVAVAALPSSGSHAHDPVECSNAGVCDRFTGTCQCHEPWTGTACDKLRCPNDCSGHGACASITEMTRLPEALPLMDPDRAVEYGVDQRGAAWDADVMRGCVCESSWSVGFKRGETQLPEWFGPDCSKRRCPSGDDPFTQADETDCAGKLQEASPLTNGRGRNGNLCHVDCSNRGICDYSTGQCACFPGSYGENCGGFGSPYTADTDTDLDNAFI